MASDRAAGGASCTSGLTPDDVGDVSAVPELLDQIEADVASLTADGAYDGAAVYDAVAERHPGASVTTPPTIWQNWPLTCL